MKLFTDKAAMEAVPGLRYDSSITGESACADSCGHALKIRKVSLAQQTLTP